MNFSVRVCQLVYARQVPCPHLNSAHSRQISSANTSRYLYKQLQDAICLHVLGNNQSLSLKSLPLHAKRQKVKIFDSDDKCRCERSPYRKSKCYSVHHAACGGAVTHPQTCYSNRLSCLFMMSTALCPGGETMLCNYSSSLYNCQQN